VASGVEGDAVSERDRSRVGGLEPGEAPEDRRLATAARTEEDQELSGLDLEIEVVDRDRRRLAGEALQQALDAYLGQ